MKSAWERALEKLDDAGIDRPDHENLTDEVRQQLDDIRQKAEAQIAELKIMHSKNIQSADPAARQELEANLQRDRARIESKRDGALEKLRK